MKMVYDKEIKKPDVSIPSNYNTTKWMNEKTKPNWWWFLQDEQRIKMVISPRT